MNPVAILCVSVYVSGCLCVDSFEVRHDYVGQRNVDRKWVCCNSMKTTSFSHSLHMQIDSRISQLSRSLTFWDCKVLDMSLSLRRLKAVFSSVEFARLWNGTSTKWKDLSITALSPVVVGDMSALSNLKLLSRQVTDKEVGALTNPRAKASPTITTLTPIHRCRVRFVCRANEVTASSGLRLRLRQRLQAAIEWGCPCRIHVAASAEVGEEGGKEGGAREGSE